jgi:phospholipid-binding lipoprotein MlaA
MNRLTPLLLLLALVLSSTAQAKDATPGELSPGDPSRGEASVAAELLDGYSHGVFNFNRFIYTGVGELPEQLSIRGGATLSHVGGGLVNFVSNLTNEPITAVASLLVGDLTTARRAVERFAINSTVGFLGVVDRASEWGYPPRHTDFGLSLCRLGVGEGGYVVLPFIGPRTVRDGVSDVVLTNLLLWPLVGAVTGGGASLRTVLIAESIEIAADVVATRQIDPLARQLSMDDYDAMRAGYLAQRRLRCGLGTDAPRALR